MPILDEEPPAPGRRSRAWTASAVAVALLAGGWGLWHWQRRVAPPAPAVRVPRPASAEKRPGPEPTLAASPARLPAPGVSKLRPPPEAIATVLRIEADVPGASVFLDHKFLGTAPVETRDFEPGTHRVNVSADGYEMYAETIDIGPGRRELKVSFKEVRLDERLSVVHKHALGSCRGTLYATTAGLRYDASPAKDSWEAAFDALGPLQVDYLQKNLRVKAAGGRSYNFTSDSADALLSFQKAVEAARKRL